MSQEPETVVCPLCNGRKYLKPPPGMLTFMPWKCHVCQGEGRILLQQFGWLGDLIAVCREFVGWFDGWCPDHLCCARSGLPVQERAIKVLEKVKGKAP